jgi:DNA (cytosine-5)-methyltransferase 1
MGLGGHNVPFVLDARGLRKLTEHECLRLQGFDKLVFPDDVPRARRYAQVGNSIAVPVAHLIAEKVLRKLFAG